MTKRKTKQPVAVVCHDGKRCKGTHPLICRDHGCGILVGRAAAADFEARESHAGPRSDQRMVGRRKLEPRVSEAKRWAVEGTCFGLNWIEVERASHATKKAALADMRSIAKRMPHLQLRVVVVVERRDVIAWSGAKPPNDKLTDAGTKDYE